MPPSTLGHTRPTSSSDMESMLTMVEEVMVGNPVNVETVVKAFDVMDAIRVVPPLPLSQTRLTSSFNFIPTTALSLSPPLRRALQSSVVISKVFIELGQVVGTAERFAKDFGVFQGYSEVVEASFRVQPEFFDWGNKDFVRGKYSLEGLSMGLNRLKSKTIIKLRMPPYLFGQQVFKEFKDMLSN